MEEDRSTYEWILMSCDSECSAPKHGSVHHNLKVIYNTSQQISTFFWQHGWN